MRWDERQLAMLEAMGIRLWPAAGGPQERAGPAADARVGASADAGAVGAVVRIGVDLEAGVDRPADVDRPAEVEARAEADAGAPVDATESAVPATALAAAAPARTPATDWPALREAVAACRACALGAGRREAVFGAGHERAHWMIVGDAPTEPDELQGEPFAGKAGQLLDNMLRAIGLTRGDAPPAQQVYVAHGVKCRPPEGRPPEAGEIAQCAAHLVRQLQWVQPRVVLAMGPVAAQSLLGRAEPIGRLRGRVHRAHGVAVVATFHPTYLLRQPDDKARAWDDLCLALEAARAEEPA